MIYRASVPLTDRVILCNRFTRRKQSTDVRVRVRTCVCENAAGLGTAALRMCKRETGRSQYPVRLCRRCGSLISRGTTRTRCWSFTPFLHPSRAVIVHIRPQTPLLHVQFSAPSHVLVFMGCMGRGGWGRTEVRVIILLLGPFFPNQNFCVYATFFYCSVTWLSLWCRS